MLTRARLDTSEIELLTLSTLSSLELERSCILAWYFLIRLWPSRVRHVSSRGVPESRSRQSVDNDVPWETDVISEPDIIV